MIGMDTGTAAAAAAVLCRSSTCVVVYLVSNKRFISSCGWMLRNNDLRLVGHAWLDSTSDRNYNMVNDRFWSRQGDWIYSPQF